LDYKERHHLRDLDGRIILKWIWRNSMMMLPDFTGRKQGSTANFYEHHNELSGSIKSRNFNLSRKPQAEV
jgi:hypothetical protein